MTRYVVESVVRHTEPTKLELWPHQIATLYHCVIAMRQQLNLPKLMLAGSKELALAEHYDEIQGILSKALDEIKAKLLEDSK